MYNLLRQWLCAGLITSSLGGCYLPSTEDKGRDAFSLLPMVVTLRLSKTPSLQRRIELQVNERVQATVMVTNRTSKSLTLMGTEPTFFYITAYNVDDLGLKDPPADLSITSRGNAQILFPPPQTNSFVAVERTVPANQTVSEAVDVRFSLPGIYFIRGVLRVSVTNDGPTSTNEVLVYSPPTIVQVR